MIEIIPSILVESAKEFERRLRLVDGHVKTVHVDILDGTSFPHTSWHDAQMIGDINTPVVYEIHLMVENPLPIIAEWVKHVRNVRRAIIHAELDRPIGLVLEEIKQIHKLEAGLAFNPETTIKDKLNKEFNLDAILVMGIHPGSSGQTFLGEPILERIRRLRTDFPTLPIGCDGGVNQETAGQIIAAGCTRLVAASAIFEAADPLQALKDLQAMI